MEPKPLHEHETPKKKPPTHIDPNIPMSERGIEETLDVIRAADRVAIAVIHAVKDGRVDVSDAVSIATDDEVRKALLAAAQGVTVVPAEIEDLSAEEAHRLAKRAIDIPFNVVQALKE